MSGFGGFVQGVENTAGGVVQGVENATGAVVKSAEQIAEDFVIDHLNQIPGFQWITPGEQHALKYYCKHLWQTNERLFFQAINELHWVLENPDKALKDVLDKLFGPFVRYVEGREHEMTSLAMILQGSHQEAGTVLHPLEAMQAQSLSNVLASQSAFTANTNSFASPLELFVEGLVEIGEGIALVIGGIVLLAKEYEICAAVVIGINLVTTAGDFIPDGFTQVLDAVVKAVTIVATAVLMYVTLQQTIDRGAVDIISGAQKIIEAEQQMLQDPNNPIKPWIIGIVVLIATGVGGLIGYEIFSHNNGPVNFTQADFERMADEILNGKAVNGAGTQFSGDCSKAEVEAILKKLAAAFPKLSEKELKFRALDVMRGLKAQSQYNAMIQQIQNDPLVSSANKLKLINKINNDLGPVKNPDYTKWKTTTTGDGVLKNVKGDWAEYQVARDPSIKSVSDDISNCNPPPYSYDRDALRVVNGQDTWIEVKNVDSLSNYDKILDPLKLRMEMARNCGMNYNWEVDVPTSIDENVLRDRLVTDLLNDPKLGLSKDQLDSILNVRSVNFGDPPSPSGWCNS